MLHKDYDHKGSVEKNLVVSLKELGARTNWSAVNLQSQSNSNTIYLRNFLERNILKLFLLTVSELYNIKLQEFTARLILDLSAWVR
jgi:hypothetical protein